MDAFRIGVIFDCDGTLIDSMMVWRETEAGLPHSSRFGAACERDVDGGRNRCAHRDDHSRVRRVLPRALRLGFVG